MEKPAIPSSVRTFSAARMTRCRAGSPRRMGSVDGGVFGTIETIAYTCYRYDIGSILQRGVESMRSVNARHLLIERSPKLPGWLKPVNAAMKVLQRAGIALGSIHLICVPGRRTGQMRTTP